MKFKSPYTKIENGADVHNFNSKIYDILVFFTSKSYMYIKFHKKINKTIKPSQLHFNWEQKIIQLYCKPTAIGGT